jgi:response regulator RpfG family c-di-GMP phosphodiesterase/CheY-like chemotaxis protein
MTKKLGERLIDSGLVTAEAVRQALHHQKITGHKLGDCLVEIGAVHESALLRFLAVEFKTRFVSTDKLAQVKIASEVLDRIPVRMAEAQHILPIALDEEQRVLSVVMAEPQNTALVQEIALVTQVEEVYPFIALRSAISAAIRKHYYGDPGAFTTAETGGPNPTDLGAMSGAFEAPLTDPRRAMGPRFEADSRTRARTLTATHPTQLREALRAVRGSLGENDYIETLNILVGMLELQRRDLRGHSGQVARQAVMVARKMGLPPREVAHVSIAAYLHDLGKRQDRHFSLASNAANPEWKADSKRFVRAPVKLFETVHLPIQVNAILAQLYEAYDGTGVPQGARGEEIALGARVLAAVDSFLDLTKNPANAQGRALSKADALAHLRAEAGKLYDPSVVEVLEQLQTGELLRQKLECDGRVVLVVEPDGPVRTTVVELLGKSGVVAHGVAVLDGVVEALHRGEADMLVASLRLGLAELLPVLRYLRTQPETAGLPVAVLGDPTDPAGREQLTSGGVQAILPLPLMPEAHLELVELYRRRVGHNCPGRPVQGSFDELVPPRVLEVLAHGKKSGRLTIRRERTEAQLYFEEGRAVFASVNGKPAPGIVREVLLEPRGEFLYEPDALLMELPILDKDLEALARDLKAPAS